MFKGYTHIRYAILLGALMGSFFVSHAQELDSILKPKQATWKSTVPVALSYGLLSTVWYSQFELESFHFFDDLGEWGGVDKLGHAFSGYYVSEKLQDFHGFSTPSKSALLGFTYVSGIEVLDGFAQEWGASWTDLVANAAGAGIWLLGERGLPIRMKFSYFPQASLAKNNPSLLGDNGLTQILKNYNGQQYWLSYPIKQTRFGKIALSTGYGATNFTNARKGNNYLDFSLDFIPAADAPWYFKVWKYVKIPFPSLRWINGGIKVKALSTFPG